MKPLYRILFLVLCMVPGIAGAMPVATTAGDNLTAYNPNSMGTISNNQWNSMLNGRTNSGAAPTADYGNCNAVIMRCATPKCSGCTTMDIARPIVTGCVNTNTACKQYGTDLIEYISAQLVSTAAARAQTASAPATQQNNAQLDAIQAQMQQMQRDIQVQNDANVARLEQELNAQKALTAAAQEQAAAATAAAEAKTASGLTPAQESAVSRGVDTELLVRADITGEIMSRVENAETALKALYATMQEAFKYAECDTRGDNCKAPKRVKAFKDKAIQFIEPYDDVIDEMYDALETSLAVGVDVSDVIMMLNGTCNQWGLYLCDGEGTARQHKPETYSVKEGEANCGANGRSIANGNVKAGFECSAGMLVPPQADNRCHLISLFSGDNSEDAVKLTWFDQYADGGDSHQRVGCATSALDSLSIFGRRKSRKSSTVQLEVLERMITQEPSDTLDDDAAKTWCGVDNMSTLEGYVIQKKLPTNLYAEIVDSGSDKNGLKVCESSSSCDDEEAYVNPEIALCSIHVYNAKAQEGNPKDDEDRKKVNDIIRLKTTIITQQMYKQYQQIDSLLNRLTTQLEKAVLQNRLKMASGETDSSSDSESESKETWKDSVKDCQTIMDNKAVLSCYENNINTFSNVLSTEGASRVLRTEIYNNFAKLKTLKFQTSDQDCVATECTETMKLNKKTFEACISESRNCLRQRQNNLSLYNAAIARGTLVGVNIPK